MRKGIDMNSKHMIKKMMAAGIQRNDAATFVKVYHAVKAAGMTRLFPELELPPEPFVRTKMVEPYRLKAEHAVDYQTLERVGATNYERYVKSILEEALVRGLTAPGAIKITRRDECYGVVFCAEARLLPPEEDLE